MQSDGLNRALSPVVYGDIALSINTHYITLGNILRFTTLTQALSPSFFPSFTPTNLFFFKIVNLHTF